MLLQPLRMAVETALENLKRESERQTEYPKEKFMEFAEGDMDEFGSCHLLCVINHECELSDGCEYAWRSIQHGKLYDAWNKLKKAEKSEYEATLAP